MPGKLEAAQPDSDSEHALKTTVAEALDACGNLRSAIRALAVATNGLQDEVRELLATVSDYADVKPHRPRLH